MFETLKLSLINWSVDGQYLPAECAYIIGRLVIKEKEIIFDIQKKFNLIQEQLFLAIKVGPHITHRVIVNCLYKNFHGANYGLTSEIERIYQRKFKEHGIDVYIEGHTRLIKALDRDIMLYWHTLIDLKDIELVRKIVMSLGKIETII